MKMVTEPPRSQNNRSNRTAAGAPKRAAAGAQSQPGARKRNPAVKAVSRTQPSDTPARQPRANGHAGPDGRAGRRAQGGTPGRMSRAAQARLGTGPTQAGAPSPTGEAGGPRRPHQQAGSGDPAAKGPKAKQPNAKRAASTRQQAPASRPKRNLFSGGKGSRVGSVAGWIKAQVGDRHNPNVRGIATLVLIVIAVIALGYGGIVQSQAVAHARQLEGYRARVVTTVVVSNGLTGTKVDVNGEAIRVAQVQDSVPVGQPLRVRMNPINPNYLVDARISPTDAISTAQRNRLVTLVLALIAGACAVYLIYAGRSRR